MDGYPPAKISRGTRSEMIETLSVKIGNKTYSALFYADVLLSECNTTWIIMVNK